MNYSSWTNQELINEVMRLKQDQKDSHSFAKADSRKITDAHVKETALKNTIRNKDNEITRLADSLRAIRKEKKQLERELSRLKKAS